jgi:hypothetical protein
MDRDHNNSSHNKGEDKNIRSTTVSLNGNQGFFRYSLYWSNEKDSNIIQLELKTNHEKTVEEQAILTPKNITASFYKENYTSGLLVKPFL